jgi:hypothetical protein
MSTVFIVQNQQRRSHDNSGFVPRYDFTPAEQYGDLEFLLGPAAGPFRPESIIAELHEKLVSFSNEDYLVLVGNPCIIGWAVAIAADYNDGDLRLLQWGRGRYQVIRVTDLFAS